MVSTGAPGGVLGTGFLEVKGSLCPEGVQSLVERDRLVNSQLKVIVRGVEVAGGEQRKTIQLRCGWGEQDKLQQRHHSG